MSRVETLRPALGTLRNHLSSTIGKTGAGNRVEAWLLADGYGWL